MLKMAYISNTLGGRSRQISEFEASLVYRVSSRTARATQRNPCFEKVDNSKSVSGVWQLGSHL
jgi:hypothetical protein